jgi:hypothetical protein
VLLGALMLATCSGPGLIAMKVARWGIPLTNIVRLDF